MDTWKTGLLGSEKEHMYNRLALIKPSYGIRGLLVKSVISYGFSLGLSKDTLLENITSDISNIEDMEMFSLLDYNQIRLNIAQSQTASFDDTAIEIGRQAARDFLDSTVGQTMILIASKDPHKLLISGPSGYSLTIDDGGTREYTQTGEREAQFAFKGDLVGACHEVAVFQTAMCMACKIKVDIELKQTSIADFTLIVRW